MVQGLPFSVVVLAAVFILIAVRQMAGLHLRIWQIVLGGAIAVLLTGQITVQAAASYVDPTVIAFLICIFIVGEALEESGYLQHVSYRIFRRAGSVSSLVLLIMVTAGVASIFLMNDTLAVIGTPVVMLFADRERINPKLMLLALAFAVTIGSAMSPIGNPQNLLITLSGLVNNPFPIFFWYLALPTLINLLIAYLVLRLFFRREFRAKRLVHARIGIRDRRLAALCKVSLGLILILICVDVIGVSFGLLPGFNIAYIAIAASIPIVLFSKGRFRIIRSIDWSTIVFFVSIFVLMGSVWQSGFIQGEISSLGLQLASIPTVLSVSVVGSQFISNVPMVLLYLRMLAYTHVPVSAVMALAAGSTMAGNLFILGAASNVIIIQSAERRHRQTLSFIDFARVGVVLTALNILVYWVFLSV